eukprot:20292-Heterococcus_DN1.PRE.2
MLCFIAMSAYESALLLECKHTEVACAYNCAYLNASITLLAATWTRCTATDDVIEIVIDKTQYTAVTVVFYCSVRCLTS